MVLWLNFNGLGEFLTTTSQQGRSKHEKLITYIASSNFFSVNALLPSALSASAMFTGWDILVLYFR